MITSALLRTETETLERDVLSLVQQGLIGMFLGGLGMTMSVHLDSAGQHQLKGAAKVDQLGVF
jgi:hypothetical protein